jgi:multiple antibiotic resistance protein
MELASVAFTLFLVMDPLGNIPLFLSALKEVPPERRRAVLVRELLIAYGVLVACLLVGQPLLRSLSLDPEAISIAGGIVLFLIALRMIFPSEGGVLGDPVEGEPFIVPLAIPLLAGPSALSAILVLARSAPERTLGWLGALTVAWAASAAILLASNVFYRVLRRRGLVALERVMGMILVMLAVQMFLDGLAQRAGTFPG